MELQKVITGDCIRGKGHYDLSGSATVCTDEKEYEVTFSINAKDDSIKLNLPDELKPFLYQIEEKVELGTRDARQNTRIRGQRLDLMDWMHQMDHEADLRTREMTQEELDKIHRDYGDLNRRAHNEACRIRNKENRAKKKAERELSQ